MKILFPGWVLCRKIPSRVKASVIWAIGWLLTEAGLSGFGETLLSSQPSGFLPSGTARASFRFAVMLAGSCSDSNSGDFLIPGPPAAQLTVSGIQVLW